MLLCNFMFLLLKKKNNVNKKLLTISLFKILLEKKDHCESPMLGTNTGTNDLISDF